MRRIKESDYCSFSHCLPCACSRPSAMLFSCKAVGPQNMVPVHRVLKIKGDQLYVNLVALVTSLP